MAAMFSRRRHSLLPLLVLALASAGMADNSLTPEERAEGWRLLFDGRSLNGWTRSAKSDSFTVDQGAIKATRLPRFREDLATAEHFEDFELAFEWKISPGGNSGVKYRVQGAAAVHPELVPPDLRNIEAQVAYALEHPAPRERMPADGKGQVYVVAFEYQVIDNAGHADAKSSRKSWAGALYQLAGPEEDSSKPVGEWNQGRIVVRGHHTQHWLNGRKTVDISLDSPAVQDGLEKRWGADSPVFRLLTQRPRRRGPIVLQNHNDEAWFRNLKIRPR